MNYLEAKAKLEEYGQEHVLRYYEELDETARRELLQQIEETDFSVTKMCSKAGKPAERGIITPLSAMELTEIEREKERFAAIGLNAIRTGKVGAVLLAGGMGTRLGSDDPKGMYNVGLTKDVFIFQRLIENLMEVVKAADA